MKLKESVSKSIPPMASSDRRFCIAPMMDWSDKHCRYFWRLLSKRAYLYTEMVTTGALLHGDKQQFLDFNPKEHPLALQVGGSVPQDLAKAARLAEQWGYDEINLNCGCPSDRVQSGRFGACLMSEPTLVADCIKAMLDACDIPVTIKHRTGVDDLDSYKHLHNFVAEVAEAGCKVFIVHARKAWLKGLSPKQNREVPPLQYDTVTRLKRDFPNLSMIINGGIKSLESSASLLAEVDGVMIGREAYQNPYLLAEVDQRLFGDSTIPLSRSSVLQQYIAYCERQMQLGTRLHHMSRHILGLFQGQAGARKFRRYISENAYGDNASVEVLTRALAETQG